MTKLEAVTEFLKHGVTHILLDARQPGVVVPESLRRADLQLKISYRFDPPDLDVSDRAITCTLAFGRERFRVTVPWAALYGAVSFVTERGEQWERPDEPPVLTKRRGGLGLVS